MRKNIQYTAVILALAAFVVSCNKVDNNIPGDDLISFAPQVVGTKAMVNDVTGLQTQTFAVKDIVDGALYIDNAVAYNGTGWVYSPNPDDAKKYLWKNGTHNLFGYTAGMGTFAGTTLTLPSTTLTTAYDQTDLLYSDIVTTTADAWKASGKAKGDPVPLHFHHLLSAISITVENHTPKDIVINSASVSLPNQAAPKINFTGTTPVPAIGTLTKGDFIATAMSAPVTLAASDSLDVLAQAKLASKAQPAQCMIWPQTLAANGAQVTISFVQDGETKSATVSIPEGTVWNAGKINAYNILIRPTSIELVFEVQPWQEVEGLDKIDTATGSINMSNVTWVQQIVNGKNTVDNDNKAVYLIKNGDNYTPAKGYFTVNYPTEGTYEISLIPAEEGAKDDLQYFSVSPSGKQTLPVVDGIPQTIYFTISANNPGTDKHVAAINITITPKDGEPVSAYSEIRANYTLTINADPE